MTNVQYLDDFVINKNRTRLMVRSVYLVVQL